MPEIPEHIAAARASLLEFLAPVKRDAWDSPTLCTGWTVKDVLAHLVDGELNAGRIYRGEVNELGRIDPHEAIERWRPLPGVAVRAALWQHGVASQRVLEAMTPERWTASIRAFGCRRMSQLARLHLFELCVHSHDITDALRAEPIWRDHLPVLVELVVRAAPRALARAGLALEGRFEVAVEGKSWMLEEKGGSWTARRADDGPPVRARITADPPTVVLSATGRLSSRPAVAIDGDAAAAEALLGAWRVV